MNLRDNPSYKFVYSICPIPYKSRSIVIVMYPGDKHQHTNCSVNVPHLPHNMNVLRPEQTYPPNEPVAQQNFFSKNPMLLLTVFILIIYSKMYERILSLYIWNMLVVFLLRVVYIYVCFSDNKNTDVLLTYMHLYLYVIYGNYFGVALSTPYF